MTGPYMKILLIEDDEVIGDFICKGMREAGFTAERFDNGVEGLNAALCQNYDLAIVDVMLPGMDGLAVIDKIRERKLPLPIIVLSAKRSVDDKVLGLQHGGDDYLTKPFSFSELLARVQALLRRINNVTESTSLNYKDLYLDILARTITRGDKKIDLQPKEFALLEYLLRNKGHVVSKTMIMERVWNYNFDPCTNVVEARISKLRDKIDKGSPEQIIHTVRGLGYVLK